jgi:hypothetical protein
MKTKKVNVVDEVGGGFEGEMGVAVWEIWHDAM